MVSAQARVALAVALLISLYVSGGLVTFDDPSDAGFGIGVFALSYPALLPLIHRLLAVAAAAGWFGAALGSRKTSVYRYSLVTLVLIVVQCAIGVLVAQGVWPGLNDYFVLAHFSVSGLIIVVGGVALIRSLEGG